MSVISFWHALDGAIWHHFLPPSQLQKQLIGSRKAGGRRTAQRDNLAERAYQRLGETPMCSSLWSAHGRDRNHVPVIYIADLPFVFTYIYIYIVMYIYNSHYSIYVILRLFYSLAGVTNKFSERIGHWSAKHDAASNLECFWPGADELVCQDVSGKATTMLQ